MMSLFASDILQLAPPGSVVDIAITKHARFLDKSGELAQHYPGVQEQVYLTGYDTLVRILDTKYYPVAYTLEPLQVFFESNRIWCMLRTGDEWGGREAQMAYLEAIKRGDREVEGCKKEWGERIKFMVGPEAFWGQLEELTKTRWAGQWFRGTCKLDAGKGSGETARRGSPWRATN